MSTTDDLMRDLVNVRIDLDLTELKAVKLRRQRASLVAHLRLEGMTVASIAERLGVSRQTLHQWNKTA